LNPHIDQDKEYFTGGPAFKAPFYTIPDELQGIGCQKNDRSIQPLDVI